MPLIQTYSQKKDHPILSKIPDQIWKEVFKAEFNDDTIKDLEKPFADLERINLPVDGNQALILLRLCYPALSPEQWVPFAQKELNRSYENIFYFSAILNDIPTLNWLAENIPVKLNDMIAAEHYHAFRKSAAYGHLDILKWLAENASDKLTGMIAADNYWAFGAAATNGYLNILNWLEEKAPNKLADMIAVGDYWAFFQAAVRGHFDTLKWLEEKMPDKFDDMMKTENYWLFMEVAGSGRLDILKWFAEKAPNKIDEMISENLSLTFKKTVSSRHNDTTRWLLLSPPCLSYAEAHVDEYSAIVNPFIQETLQALHLESDAHLEANPNIVFDLSARRASHCFYMLRNLIRRNDRTLDDEMRFLLNIPAVKVLAHQNNNELLRLAMNLENRDAANLMIAIPAVNDLAAAADYYRAEARNGLDARELARDRESSMTALSVGEKRRFEKAIQYYKKPMEDAGIPNLMNHLREKLVERYEAKPASITINDQLITLPCSHEDFKTLNLDALDTDHALKAYYNHPDHTAWRYLSKPNHWMHPHAAYVNMNARCSTFEEYQPFISMLFLAAIDETHPPTEGHTLESRFEHFVRELALIGRAHNWDRTRIRGNKEEEYDDEEGDRPSCYSGVKRRLFQSVIGHDLLSVLTREKIQQEIRAFALDHFKSFLSTNNMAIELRDAYSNYILEQEDAFARPLLALNIPKERQDAFYRMLVEKYGDSFTTELLFTSLFHSSFHLNEKGKTAERCHVLKLDGLTQMGTFLMGLYPEIPVSEHSSLESNAATSPIEASSVASSFFFNKEDLDKKEQTPDMPRLN